MDISLGGKNGHLRADRQILDSPRIGLQDAGEPMQKHEVKLRELEEVERQVFAVAQMPSGLVVPISCGATGGRGAQRGQCPDRARGGQAS